MILESNKFFVAKCLPKISYNSSCVPSTHCEKKYLVKIFTELPIKIAFETSILFIKQLNILLP